MSIISLFEINCFKIWNWNWSWNFKTEYQAAKPEAMWRRCDINKHPWQHIIGCSVSRRRGSRLTWSAWTLTNGVRCRQLAATDWQTDAEVTSTRSAVTSSCNYWPLCCAAHLSPNLISVSLRASLRLSICRIFSSSRRRSALPIIICRQTPSKQSPTVHFQFDIRPAPVVKQLGRREKIDQFTCATWRLRKKKRKLFRVKSVSAWDPCSLR